MADDDEPPSRRNALIAMVAILLLVVGGIWLARVLQNSGQLEDCLMAGRRNCTAIHGAP
jgi:hypothetical protein